MLPRPHNNNKQKILLLRTIALFRSRDYRQAPTSIIFHGGLICVGRNLSPIPAVITSRQGSRTLHQFWCLRNFEFADYHPNEYPASLSLPTLPVSPRLRITIIFNLTTIQLFQLIMMIKYRPDNSSPRLCNFTLLPKSTGGTLRVSITDNRVRGPQPITRSGSTASRVFRF